MLLILNVTILIMISENDIMVGDWLQNTNGNVGKVIGIRPYMGTAPSMKYDYEVIMQYHQTGTAFSDPKLLKPIPLTPEILEKNGFKKEGRYFIIEDDYYDVSIREITDSIWRVKYCNTEFSAFDSILHIAFIHELQHFLRHHKIEKKIVL